MGVSTAPETRKPVSTQVVQAVLEPNVLLERAERREDHRLLERERSARQGQDRERDVVVLAPVIHAAR